MRVDVGDFHRLAARQRDVEARLRREVERATREAARSVEGEVAASARSHLPAGLAAWVAAAPVRVDPQSSGNRAGVEISSGRDTKGGGAGRLAEIDAGTVHHQAWGRGRGIAQQVRPGYWSDVMTGDLADRARRGLREALERTARGK